MDYPDDAEARQEAALTVRVMVPERGGLADFRCCQIVGESVVGAPEADWSGSMFRGADLYRSYFYGGVFQDVSFTNCE